METVPSLVIQTLSTDTGVKDVWKSLSGNSTLNFYRETVKVTGDEYDAVYSYLTKIYGNDPSSYSLIIKDTSITSVTAENVASYVGEIISLDKQGSYTFDVCILGRFLDNCNQYSDTKTVGISNSNGSTETVTETSSYVSRTTGAKGVEAILFSPSGMNKFLSDVKKYPSFNETIYYAIYGTDGNSGVLRGISFNPALYSFNPIWSTSMSDYVKTSQCTNTKPPTTPASTTSSVLQFFIFIIVIVLILLLTWFVFNITPQPVYGVPGI